MQENFWALMQNSWDIHVHAAPSLFPRKRDAWQLAQECENSGMEGVVLKSHHGSTVELAKIISGHHRLLVYGGIVLNHHIGGLNRYAVGSCLQLGGKMVWLPTIHSAFHEKKMGFLGGFSFQNARNKICPPCGLTIIDDSKRLASDMKEIVSLLNNSQTVLATGHLSPEEIFVLYNHIKRERYDIHLLVNHVLFTMPGLTVEMLQQLQASWTWFELVYFCHTSSGNGVTGSQTARLLRALPDANWIMASDSGQIVNPSAPEALGNFVEELLHCGVAEKQLRQMLRTRPRELLFL